ncbi:uncharacterized mitochondrial protein AtMg00860-like [Benincasa hispida]|uniref:uncharacterized mitochondrial protein AtMg00860-like n=1 Tax=Benincasa hispida TaxID=102211 RepID=UPI001902293D|nr:uncharacterized mitochondrial protein AtMg00860-like [Benincasa hispida]
MPSGLCNALSTFQRCMMAIFSEYLEDSVEIFTDDFSNYGQTYEVCIVLGHKVSKEGLEVDKAKIEAIEKLPPPANVKPVKSFLGHVGFYHHFMNEFLKIARPLSALLEADRTLHFDTQCLNAFKILKNVLTTVLVLIAPNWTKTFELMCDASGWTMPCGHTGLPINTYRHVPVYAGVWEGMPLATGIEAQSTMGSEEA